MTEAEESEEDARHELTASSFAARAIQRVRVEFFALIRQIKDALRIGGVRTNTASWRSEKRSGGAQADLVIDRKDGVINLCEMKFTSAPFAIGPRYEGELRNKISLFKEETETRSSVHLTMVTVDGVRRNEHSGIVQSEVTLDDLFRP